MFEQIVRYLRRELGDQGSQLVNPDSGDAEYLGGFGVAVNGFLLEDL